MDTIEPIIPTIDISPLFGTDTESKLKVAKEIHDVSKDHGFFFASNHGIDFLDEFVRITRKFHQSMSDEEKWHHAINAYNKDNYRQRNGYYLPIPGKKPVESYCFLNPDFSPDHPVIKSNTPMAEINYWPDEKKHEGFKELQESYYWAIFKVTQAILSGYALGLGKDENFFNPYFRRLDTLSSVKLIRYPYVENYPPVKVAPDGTKISFDNHIDVDLITVLYQPFVANLQVRTENGTFFNVPSSNDCFLVNVGGYMDYITNGYFQAKVHRVKWVNAERLSLPFFVNLAYDSLIEPFTPKNSSNQTKNQPMTFGQYYEKARLDLIVSNGQT
eukprot:gene2166-2666_t